MTRTRSQIGRENKRVGDALEDWLGVDITEGQHHMAWQLGILAHVEKTQAKSKVVGGRLIFEKKGIADYVGCLMPGSKWQYLAVEAKSTAEDRFSKSEVSPKQQQHLDAVVQADGLALLVVEFRLDVASLRRRYAVNWSRVPWTVLRTAESVAEADLTEWFIEPNTCYLSRWHPGGPRSSAGARGRVYPTE